MSISSKIRKRLQDANVRFWAGDNISNFINEEEKRLLIDEVTEKFEAVLDSLVIDRHNDPNSMGTGRRLAKMYINEIMSGRYDSIPEATAFPNVDENRYSGLLVVRAELTSLCSHHHQTVRGVAYIGIVPNEKVIGLSKYIRIAQWCAKRGTLQEELCNDIAREIRKATGSDDVAVYLKLTHGCVENRGVCANDSTTQTTVLNGSFNKPDVKKEFFDNIMIQELGAKR
jgi:GTP cyclohydrolase IA